MSIRYWPVQLLFAAGALAQSTTPIENDQVKVIVANEKPHTPTPLHEHKFNRVVIYEQAGTMQIEDPHKKANIVHFQAGEVAWSPVGGQHVTEIDSTEPVTIVEVELKKPNGPSGFVPGPLDPVKVDPQHYKVVLDNGQVRVLRVTIGPHESTPLHEHSLDRVATYLTDQDIRVTSADGKVERTQHKAGDVSWAGQAKHREENLSDKPFEVIVTEIKNK